MYDDIRDKLIAKGVPADEIAYIHSAKTETQKSELLRRSEAVRCEFCSAQQVKWVQVQMYRIKSLPYTIWMFRGDPLTSSKGVAEWSDRETLMKSTSLPLCN